MNRPAPTHANGSTSDTTTDAPSIQSRRVPVRQPRPASPRRQAAGIAQDIVDRMAEGLDWSWDEFGVNGDAKMIALVKSYLAFEFDTDIDEPPPMPDQPGDYQEPFNPDFRAALDHIHHNQLFKAPGELIIQQSRSLLAVAAQQVADRYGPPYKARAEKARDIVLEYQIDFDGDIAYVKSAKNPDMIYSVSQHSCDCVDAQQYAPQGLCKHRLAWQMRRSASEAHKASQRLASSAPTHPEAPVSANSFVTIEGRDVQVTVRTGATPEQVEVVLGTMAGLLRAYAAPEVTLPQIPSAAEQSQAAEAPPPTRQGRAKKRPAEKTDIWCEEDQSYFWRRYDKKGDSWLSHKRADGSWHRLED